jgi:hypothetical protein
MQCNAAIATRPVNNRSALSNDLRRLRADVDMRSAEGRRFGDVFDALAVEFSGADAGRIRELALLKYEHERAQASGLCSLEDTVRIYNVIERKERALRLAQQRQRFERDKGVQSLNEYLAALPGGGR